jgi:ammonium transporter, Amt family
LINPVDTLFVMICTGLVLLMTPALGLFFGGMVRRKNVLATFQKSFILIGAVSFQWLAVGYGLAFGPDLLGGFCGIPRYEWLWGGGLVPHADHAAGIPDQLFMIYQMLVAVFAASLISGAMVERGKFGAYVALGLVWTTLVYAPIAHWVWSDQGWLYRLGVFDFAGGLAVHLAAGVSALACCIALGHRRGLGMESLPPHNLTLSAMGTILLWLGWLGLNVGHAFSANVTAVTALVATMLAGAAGSLCWSCIEFFQKRKTTLLGTCTGAICGLVAVTPAAGYVTPLGALAIGLLAPPHCYAAMTLKGKLGFDDSLDVFGVHAIGAVVGMVGVGLFAAPGLGGEDGGLLAGNANLIAVQLLAIAVVSGYSFLITWISLRLIERLLGLRVSAEEEELGLDLSQHGQRGYILGEGERIGIFIP